MQVSASSRGVEQWRHSENVELEQIHNRDWGDRVYSNYIRSLNALIVVDGCMRVEYDCCVRK